VVACRTRGKKVASVTRPTTLQLPSFLPSTMAPKPPMPPVQHLMTLADLSVPQLQRVLEHAHKLKSVSRPWLAPQGSAAAGKPGKMRMPSQSLFAKSVALLFSKRSTRTRLSAETAAELLGGRALFLGRDDIQLGVNESARDSARVIGGMCQGIFARVGSHSEIEVGGVRCPAVARLTHTPRRNSRRTRPCRS
jgi:ornithine carbamoyltransferase